MSEVADWLRGVVESPRLIPVGWALLHSVWQLPLIAAVVAGLLSLAPRVTANTRYVTYCCGMLLMAAAPLATFLMYLPGENSRSSIFDSRNTLVTATAAPANPAQASIGGETAPAALETAVRAEGDKAATAIELGSEDVSSTNQPLRVSEVLQLILPWTAAAWLIGVALLSLRLVAGWLQVQSLRRGQTEATLDELQMLHRLAKRLGIRRKIHLVRSRLLQAPATVGWLKPLVLLPLSMTTGLSASQVEALLAHELAHIRRADYAINLLQCVLETLLFYHPAVWWISARIRAEREHCCDDIAVQICGDRHDYASALLELEESRSHVKLAMNAAGGSLKTRIARLAGKDPMNHSSPWGALGMFALSLTLLASCLLAPAQPAPATDLEVAMAPLIAPPEKEPDNAKTPPAARPASVPKTGSSTPPEKPIRVKMKVIDAVTGDAIGAVMIQAGRLPTNGKDEITWGYSETRTRSRTGNYSTSIRWHGGWTARIVADGYAPHPILTARNAPEKGVEKLEMTIKLDRGRLLKGVVLDHMGKPMSGAAVFGVTPRHLNLAGGQAINSWDGKVDKNVSGVLTDDKGQFEMYAGAAERIAISHPRFDAWVADIPPVGQPFEVRLPEPARIVFTLDVPGADQDSAIFYQFLSHHQPQFKRVETVRTVPLKNGGKLELNALTPGRYQFWRSKRLQAGNMGIGGALDHVFLEFKPGQSREVKIVRKTGARLTGEIKPPGEAELSGVILTVKSLQEKTSPFNPGHKYVVAYDTRTVHEDGKNGFKRTFTTELLEPGQYKVKAVAYVPLTPQQQFRSGIVRPTYEATTTVVIPASGEVKPVTLQLKKAVYK